MSRILVLIAMALWAGSSHACENLLTFLVRAEFAHDVSPHLGAWQVRAESFGLAPADVATDETGRVLAMSLTGTTQDVHRFAHALGGSLVSVLSPDANLTASDLARSRTDLGWDQPLASKVKRAKRADWALDAPLEEVGFDRATILKIDGNGDLLTTLRDIVVLTESELRRCPGVGDSTIASMKSVANMHGLQLGTDASTLPPPKPIDTSRLNESIAVLELKPFSRERLHKRGIMTLRDLVQFTPLELEELAFKRGQIEQMRLALKELGLSFRMRLDGTAGSDPDRVERFKATAARRLDGSIDLSVYQNQTVDWLPLSQVLQVYFSQRRKLITLEDLRNLRPHEHVLHPARLKNIEFVLGLFQPRRTFH